MNSLGATWRFWLSRGLALVGFLWPLASQAQTVFYFGNDLSYVNELEDCGAVYRENDVVVDPFELMAKHGTNLVRVRLWHDPWWQDLLPQSVPGHQGRYSDLADVKKTIRRAKAAGMKVMLGIHFSDFWADPTRQVLPRAWLSFADDDDALAAAVHDYVVSVLSDLDAEGLMPEIVKLGNENNGGIVNAYELVATYSQTSGQLQLATKGDSGWKPQRFAKIWNAAIRGVREVGASASIDPQIALHVSGHNDIAWFYDMLFENGVTDFDIVGFSYYYAWHSGTIAEVGQRMRSFKAKYPNYHVMLLETGYLWDQGAIDGLNNIINTPDPHYLPVSKANQRRYMVDLTQEVVEAGGLGVVFWEPLWISTPCRTPWGVGSSHEHVAYFDHRDNNNLHEGGTWMAAAYSGLRSAEPVVLDTAPKLSEAVVEVRFAVLAGSEYQLELSDDLGVWTLRRWFRAAEDGEEVFSLEPESESGSFARVWKLGD